MPDERIIQEIEKILSDVVALGGQEERTSIVPNMLVRDASPTDLDDYVIIADNRDNDNILALRVPGVVYADNDLVNVIFPTGGEAIAFQQGSGSTTSGLWDIVTGTDDIYYDKGDVGIGKSVAPDAALEILSASQAQLRLTFEEDVKFSTFTVDTSHDLTIDPSSTGQIKLAAVDVTIEEDLLHEGDSDTKLTFTADDIEFTAGNLSMLKLTEAGQDLITLGPGSGDVDIDFNNDMFIQGNNGYVGVGPGFKLPTSLFHMKTTTGSADVSYFKFESSNEGGSFSVEDQATAGFLPGFVFLSAGVSGFGGLLIGEVPVALDAAGAGRAAIVVDGRRDTGDALTAANLFAVRNRGTTHLTIDFSGNVGLGTGSPLAQLHVDQASTTAAEPVLSIDQADLSEEFINFISTIGAGNPIDTAAIGTYYGKVRVAVNGTFKYMALYNS